MSLQYILQQVGYKLGLNPSDTNQRATLLRFINPAAKEVYQTSDMAGSLDEMILKVNADQTIALPDYVGQIRAMRESYSQIPVNLSQLRPHYNQFAWGDQEWRNWRLKGLSCLMMSIHNQSQVVITVGAVETPNVQVTIVGSTDTASSVHETVVINSTSVMSVNSYNTITSITKSTVNTQDVLLFDVDGNQLSKIANNKLAAQFQIVDVSSAPWYPPNSDPVIGWVEVLYKKALPTFSNDSDEFPAPGYDDVIINKSLQLWFEQQSNLQVAMGYQEKSTMLLAQIHEDANRGTNDHVSLVENPHDKINPRIGFGRDWRYAYRITGR